MVRKRIDRTKTEKDKWQWPISPALLMKISSYKAPWKTATTETRPSCVHPFRKALGAGPASRRVKLGGVALVNALEVSIIWKQEAQSTRGFATRHAKRHDSRRLHLVQSGEHAPFADLTTE